MHSAKAVPTGIDLSVTYVEYARRRLADRGITIDLGDALKLPYADGIFVGWPGGLAEIFRAAPLTDVREDWVSTRFEYASFDDYWSTFLGGQGRLGGYVMSLSDPQRKDLERHMRVVYGMPDGPRAFTTWYWVVTGRVPVS